MPLEKLTRDPDETEQPARRRGRAVAAEMRRGGRVGGRAVTPKEPKIDWAGLKRRTRQVTRGGSVLNYIPANDGKTLIFVGSEGGRRRRRPAGSAAGGGGDASIYTIQDDGKRMTRIATGTPRPATPARTKTAPRHARRFSRRHDLNLSLTKDGRTLFFQEGDVGLQHDRSLVAAEVAADGGGRGGSAAVAADGGGESRAGRQRRRRGRRRRRVEAEDHLQRHRPDRQARRNGTRCSTTPGGRMKYRFYDPKMHGKDWDAMRAKYKPLVAYVGRPS